MSLVDAVTFETDANLEHQKILQAKTRSAKELWELGSRLLRFQQTGEWRNVTVGGPYTDFRRDYLERGCKIPSTTGYKYMRAAWFPLTAALQFGCDKLAMLKTIIDVTPDDETPAEAVAMELPTVDGKHKPFAAMSQEEVLAATRLVREEAGIARRGGNPNFIPSAEASELAQRLRAAAAPIINAHQVVVRKIGGRDVVDVRAVPYERVAEVFGALARAVQS